MDLPEEIIGRLIKQLKINSARENHLRRIKCYVILGARVVSLIDSAFNSRMDRSPEVSWRFRFTFIRENENDARKQRAVEA